MRKLFASLILIVIAVVFGYVFLGVGTYDIYKTYPTHRIVRVVDWRGREIPLTEITNPENLKGEVIWVAEDYVPPRRDK